MVEQKGNVFSLQPCQSLCSHIRCEAHYNEISCFTKYNINSVVTVFIIGSHTSLSTTLIQWECSWFLILCFHSVLFCCNFQLRNKRVCRPNVDFFLWNMTYHWSRKQMKNEIKTMRMRLICFFGGLNHHTMHSSCLVEIKQSFFFVCPSQPVLCRVRWGEAKKERGQENQMPIMSIFFLKWQ